MRPPLTCKIGGGISWAGGRSAGAENVTGAVHKGCWDFQSSAWSGPWGVCRRRLRTHMNPDFGNGLEGKGGEVLDKWLVRNGASASVSKRAF